MQDFGYLLKVGGEGCDMYRSPAQFGALQVHDQVSWGCRCMEVHILVMSRGGGEVMMYAGRLHRVAQPCFARAAFSVIVPGA